MIPPHDNDARGAMPPPPGEGASAWGLFGDADADASGAPSPPRADAHPFFARARRCWTIVGTDDDDDSWRRIRRVNGAIASRVPECAAALRAAGHVDVARQLASVALADVFDREDRDPREAAANRDAVVSAVVEALGDADEASSSDAQSPSAAALHGALLLARGVAAAKALDDAMDSPRDERKARIAVERATALAELATTHGCESGAIGDVRWVGDAYVAASDAFDAATTTSDLTSPTGSGRPPPPLARLPTAGVPTGVPTPSGRPGANGCADVRRVVVPRARVRQRAPVAASIAVRDSRIDATSEVERGGDVSGLGVAAIAPRRRAGAFYTLVPIRPQWRGERRSLRTFAGASLRPALAFNPRPRRLSTPTDAYELHPDIRSYGPSTLRCQWRSASRARTESARYPESS